MAINSSDVLIAVLSSARALTIRRLPSKQRYVRVKTLTNVRVPTCSSRQPNRENRPRRTSDERERNERSLYGPFISKVVYQSLCFLNQDIQLFEFLFFPFFLREFPSYSSSYMHLQNCNEMNHVAVLNYNDKNN